MSTAGSAFKLAQAFSLAEQTAIITGGARGIGAAVAHGLAQAGARVALFDQDAVTAERLAQNLREQGFDAQAHGVDVTDEAAVEQAMQAVVDDTGRIDCLFNNAGLAIRKPSLDLPLSDWNKVLDVNLTGVFICARLAARHMVTQGRGCIINTASIMGLSGGGLYPNISYQSTKGAVINLTRSLAVEWARQGIRVNAIAPTWVATDFIKPLTQDAELMARIEAMTPLGRIARVEDIVGGVIYLASPAAAMVTGHTLAIDGGFLAQ
jgi:NAD(P)-dependent dehydrogenase (short-subunit alcohol dehydrogenase family)